MLTITILGCGASGGVPLIGCKCEVCTSKNPKNKRLRVSLLVEGNGTRILIDTSPDMRQQCLRHDISKIDAIIYTHAHADHLSGLDDIRSFNYANNAPIDIYSDVDTLQQIKQRFPYAFLPPKPTAHGWYRPCLNPVAVTPYEAFIIGGLNVMPLTQMHGEHTTLGLRIGSFAYSTDTNGLQEETLNGLTDLDLWVVDCLRYEPAPTHAHLDMTLSWIEQLKPKQSYLTHLNHGFDYDRLTHELPENVYPAFDGLVLTV